MKILLSILCMWLSPSLIWGADWYVQPYTWPVKYGTADGTSYDTAWNGFASIVWGPGGVTVGDTLWVCGVHDASYPAGKLTVGDSGAPAQHITIRGDCRTKNAGYSDGVIWLVRNKYPAGYAWTGPDAYGVYSAVQYGQSNDIPAIEDQTTVLKNMRKIPDSTWPAGSYYHAPPVFYYKPSNGAANEHLVYSSVYDYSLSIFDHDYIDVKNITWKMGGAAAVAVAGANHVTLDSLDIQFARYGVQVPNNGSTYLATHNCSLTNSTIHDAGAGIYFSTDASVTDVSTNWTISGNTIYNINRADIWDADRHAIGVQGARNFTVAGNVIHDIGGPNPQSDKAAIDFYNRTFNMYLENNVVTRNLIYNALYGGIVLESNNACDPEKMKNNVMLHNVVMNGGSSGYGIAWKSFQAADGSPSVKIYNNTVYNCSNSYTEFEYATPGDQYLTSYDFRNNLSMFPISRHFRYYPYVAGQNNGNWSAITQDNNLYYPDGNYFTWNSISALMDFNYFKSLSGKDLHSHISDPGVISFSDFHLLSDSFAIDTGTYTGSTTDYSGNPIYGTPDIGAYEYQPPYTMGIDKIDISAGARIYGDGKFRNSDETSSDLADISITPEAGDFPSYNASEPRPEWLTISNILWNKSGDHHKYWTESSIYAGLTNIRHTIGDLEPDTYYDVTVDSHASGLTGAGCAVVNDKLSCKADSQGEIVFIYTGTYQASRIFDVVEGAP